MEDFVDIVVNFSSIPLIETLFVYVIESGETNKPEFMHKTRTPVLSSQKQRIYTPIQSINNRFLVV